MKKPHQCGGASSGVTLSYLRCRLSDVHHASLKALSASRVWTNRYGMNCKAQHPSTTHRTVIPRLARGEEKPPPDIPTPAKLNSSRVARTHSLRLIINRRNQPAVTRTSLSTMSDLLFVLHPDICRQNMALSRYTLPKLENFVNSLATKQKSPISGAILYSCGSFVEKLEPVGRPYF